MRLWHWAIWMTLSLNIAFAGEAEQLRVGDIVMFDLPGEESFDKPFQINRKGQVLLPEVGVVDVAGLSLSEAREKLRTLLSHDFRDLERFDLVLKERRLPVTVLGYVKTPGPVDLPADGNVQMALSEAGGLSPGAQLDKLQVRRGDEVMTFDYKQYLDSGDVKAAPALLPLDIVFVPASPLIGNVQVEFDAATLVAGGDAGEADDAIKVFGEVNNPGTFSFKPGATVVDMLMRAGGVTRYAGVERIRLINDSEPLLFDLKAYLDSGDRALLPRLRAGATLFVPKQEEEIKSGARTVYVMGEVFKPGAYEGQEDTSFFDILANAGGPTRFAETRQIRILRTSGDVIAFDLQGYTEGLGSAKPPRVFAGDAIFVPEKTDLNEKSWLKVSPKRAVRIMGAVVRPGRYEWSDEMSLLDLLAHAGGPTEKADTAHVRILVEGEQVRPLSFDLDRFMTQGGDMKTLPVIHAGTTVILPEHPEDPSDNKSRWLRQSAENSIYVFGQVGAPGRYAFNKSMSFLDILSAADGPNGDADIHNVHVTHRNENRARTTRVDLGLYFETGDETLLPVVSPGDTIYVPERNRPWLDERKEQTVRVLGAVAKPGRYRFNDQMTLLDLLAEAGGPTDKAYLEKIVVINMARAEAGEDMGRSFDLKSFVKQPDFTRLPLVRVGDTVFVPDTTSSNWQIFMSGVKDALNILSVLAIVGGL